MDFYFKMLLPLDELFLFLKDREPFNEVVLIDLNKEAILNELITKILVTEDFIIIIYQ
jgi:hypothetical protein